MSTSALMGVLHRRLGTLGLGLAGMVLLAGMIYAFSGIRSDATAGNGFNTASVGGGPGPAGAMGESASGLPLPRFVSLKTDRVNVRRGPSSDHRVAWVFTHKGLPVEIIAEFEHWRRVRDSEGEEGWIYQSLLTGRRTAIVAPWRKTQTVQMSDAPDDNADAVAMVNGGVVGRVASCDGHWCHVSVAGYDGWIKQVQLWGVYPGERIGG